MVKCLSYKENKVREIRLCRRNENKVAEALSEINFNSFKTFSKDLPASAFDLYLSECKDPRGSMITKIPDPLGIRILESQGTQLSTSFCNGLALSFG